MSWVMTSQVILDLPLEPFIYSLRMLFQNYVDEARPVSTYEKVFSCNKRCYKSYCNVLCCKGTKECTCTGCWHLLSGESFLKLLLPKSYFNRCYQNPNCFKSKRGSCHFECFPNSRGSFLCTLSHYTRVCLKAPRSTDRKCWEGFLWRSCTPVEIR